MLVDASVWIDYLRGADTPQCELLRHGMMAGDVHVADLTYFEVLQGCTTSKRVMQARTLLKLYEPVMISDLLIAETAAEH
jgi:predicted nucleic acid-binding protein